jgi:hypothetical protein
MRIYKTGYRPSRLEKYIRVRFINCTDILLPSLFFSSYHVDHHHHIIIIFQPTPLKQFPELPSTMPPVSQFPPARVFFKNAASSTTPLQLSISTSRRASLAQSPLSPRYTTTASSNNISQVLQSQQRLTTQSSFTRR